MKLKIAFSLLFGLALLFGLVNPVQADGIQQEPAVCFAAIL